MNTYAGAPRRQRGAVLLLLLLLVLMAFSYGALQRLNAADLTVARGERTAAALAEAKQALIAHALLYGEGHKTNATPTGSTTEDDVTLPPGTLPCPEQSFFGSEGMESGTCGVRDGAAIGRLPWRSLGIAPLRDGHGECLWYAVSGSYKANPAPHTLNPDSLGQFRLLDDVGNVLAGATVASQVVAVIIAPGPPLGGQNRSPVSGTAECGGNYNAGAYLDAISIAGTVYNNATPNTTANASSTFVMGNRGRFNDRVAYITREDIWRQVDKRADFASALFNAADDGVVTDHSDDGTSAHVALAQKIAAMMARYGKNNDYLLNHALPWPAPLAVGDFAADTFSDAGATNIYAGRPPFRVGKSRAQSDNDLVSSACSNPLPNCRLLIATRAGPIAWWRAAGRPLNSDGTHRHSSFDGWWDKWKDHYFYVVSREFAPNTDDDDWEDDPNPCSGGGNECVRVNGDRFAAAIIFAGKALPGQTRNTLADRQNPANYLEGDNLTALLDPTSNNHRDLSTTDPTSNDRIVCIRPQDLAIDSTCSHGS